MPVLSEKRIQALRDEAVATESSFAALLHRELRGLPYEERVREVHRILNPRKPLVTPPSIRLERGTAILPEFEVPPSRLMDTAKVKELRRKAVREGKDYGFYTYERVPIAPDLTKLQRLARKSGAEHLDYAKELDEAIDRMKRRLRYIKKSKPRDPDAAAQKEHELQRIPQYIENLQEFKVLAERQLKHIKKGTLYTRSKVEDAIKLRRKDASGQPVKAKRKIIRTDAGDAVLISARVVTKDETTKAGKKVKSFERLIPIQVTNAYKFLVGKHEQCNKDKRWRNKVVKATKRSPQDAAKIDVTDKFRWLNFAFGGMGVDKLTAQATTHGGRNKGGVYGERAIHAARKSLLSTGQYRVRRYATPFTGDQVTVPQRMFDLLCGEGLCHADERFYQDEEYLWGKRVQQVYDELERMTPTNLKRRLPSLTQLRLWLRDSLDTVVSCQGIANVLKAEAKGRKAFEKRPDWEQERMLRESPPQFGAFIEKAYVAKLGEKDVGKPFTRKRKGKTVAIQKASEVFFGRAPADYTPPKPRKIGFGIKIGKKKYPAARSFREFTEQPVVIASPRTRKLPKSFTRRLVPRRPSPLTDTRPSEFWQLLPTEEEAVRETLTPRWRRGRKEPEFLRHPPFHEVRLGPMGRQELKRIIEEQEADFPKRIRLAVQRSASKEEMLVKLKQLYNEVPRLYREKATFEGLVNYVQRTYDTSPEAFERRRAARAHRAKSRKSYAQRIQRLRRKYAPAAFESAQQEPTIKSKKHPKIKVPPPK